MKPSLSILGHVNILIAKIIDCVAAVTAKHVLPIRTSLSKPQPSWLIAPLLLLSIAPLAPAQEYGTAILLIRTRDEIVVAADSQVSDRDGNPVGITCKIRKFDNFYYVVDGMEESPEAGFYAFDILKEVSQAKTGIFDKIERLERLAKPKLERAFERTEKRDFGINFIGFIGSTPFLIGRRAVVTSAVGEPITIEFERHGCPGDVCDKNGSAAYIAPKESAARFQRDNPNYLRGDLVSTVRNFVQMNIDTKQPGVGGPIDILRITRKGAEWIQHKQECPDVQNASPQPTPKPTRPRRKRG